MKDETIKLGKVKIRVLHTSSVLTMDINFGRYKRGKEIDNWLIYNAIDEKHKPFLDEVWVDIQDKKAIGMHITIDKMSKRKFKKIQGPIRV